ncbi:hypothetical protein GPEL0_01r3949 [Geoanaerobacter pelophilus]|uniref:SGNH/GDSL hydrolase family protein n=1 Tax=Geoanaerobacter pelophilus TaxID=60036 RepID=A0ABQ0MM61_9BACT|nr:DUF1574 family protein [Geoanaerobacter pelophilus]GAW67872.1 hypothetical protein GPEL0_01r3949 [Geoanaerobacter pelophilus]
MTKLIKKIILIALPVLAFIVLFELLARTIPTSYGQKYKALNTRKDSVEVLVMGSSHANFGIDPQYFGRPGFNMANASQCLSQDYQLLLKYLPLCKNVRLVLVPISYFTLQTDLALSPEAWRCAYYSVYMGVNADASASGWELRNNSALALWEGPIGVVKNLKKAKKLRISEFGYQAPEPNRQRVDEVINDSAGQQRVGYHNKIMNPSVLQSNLAILGQMADLLKKKNIQMVLLVTPVYRTYARHVDPKIYATMVKGIAEVSNRYGVKSYNYFSDSRFDISDFSDNDHLNERGAKKLSLILKQEIIDAR